MTEVKKFISPGTDGGREKDKHRWQVRSGVEGRTEGRKEGGREMSGIIDQMK